MANDLSLPASSELGERIRLLANLAGGTPELASATGWTPRTIQRYISGVYTPTRPKLARLSRATGCDLVWLLSGKGTAPTDSARVMASIRRAKRNPLMDEDWQPVSPLLREDSTCPIHFVSLAWVQSICGPLDIPEPIGCLKVKDASMAPAYLPGDLLLVAPSPSGDESESVLWKDYAIRAYGEWYIRRKTPHGWDAITQGAVNFPFDSELVEVYGRVFAKVQVL
jgi:transcriptional regulator with XRE-family HTH domain